MHPHISPLGTLSRACLLKNGLGQGVGNSIHASGGSIFITTTAKVPSGSTLKLDDPYSKRAILSPNFGRNK